MQYNNDINSKTIINPDECLSSYARGGWDQVDLIEGVREAISYAKNDANAFALICIKLISNNQKSITRDLFPKLKESVLPSQHVTFYFTKDGEHIYIVIMDVTSTKIIESCSNIINNNVRTYFAQLGECDGEPPFVMGCAVFPFDGHNEWVLIGNAQTAAHRAEISKVKILEYYEPIKDKNFEDNLKIYNGLYGALERNEFEVYYQPQIDARNASIVGLEALIRWRHPELGLIRAGKFISIAEKSGHIIKLDQWVLKTVCEQEMLWKKSGYNTIPISVNISPRLFEETDIVGTIKEVLKSTCLSPDKLEIEITESYKFVDINKISKKMLDVKNLGVSLALDDFGKEYSSLFYINNLPFDKVKIDKEFLNGNKHETVLKSVIDLISNLKQKIVAEGVETTEQIEFLMNNNCYTMQGYYYFQPMPANKLEKLLKLTEVSITGFGGRENIEFQKEVYVYLNYFQIKHSNRGYRYIFRALLLVTNQPSLLNNMGMLYALIAEAENTKDYNVERAIRYVTSSEKMTNKEFITRAAMDCRIRTSI